MARFDMDLYQSPFLWDPELEGGLGVYMVALGAWAVVGWALLLCPRPSLAPAPLPPGGEAEEDKDVAAERIKIQCGGAALYDTVLRLVGLGRDFSSPPVTAVGNLFLAIRRGECFSLLGLNGAGKTTTFRCLTGELRPSRGQILVNGLPLEEALDLSRPVLSYCPQSHALDPNLTPREALINMARIKGASGTRTRKGLTKGFCAGLVVERAMKQLGLSGEADTFVRHLSGGNKRKLSVALALLGNPLLVLMDEPTTGMDPASRRLVWRAIQSVSQAGRSVLLTSHSMDEVNQLSHRLAIMVNGHFVCLGSPHYLKHRLGDKYTVRLKTRDIEDMSYVLDYLRSHLKEVLLKDHPSIAKVLCDITRVPNVFQEQHHLSLTVEVSRQLPLQLIFDTMNGAKSLGVTEYDVSQTTLNEVFRVLTSYQSDGCSALRDRRPTLTQDTLPSLIPHLYQAKTKPTTKDPTYQRLSVLAPVECAASPTAPYDNYGYVMGSFGKDGSPVPKNGAAKDSTQEEWTHL
ncbi:ATP-binding cassette sub-family A member 2 [Chionoecetes opilio]|uniref:ATP-binding cassette sub-family A member 2 n=1 Tax=Chionoecetes opilio TaxID=41210 RepID=A0A8J4XSF0_CHIOP|nr:ATP-binding cassette sub-family A member 2 [Chionoecetes opilio]